VPITVIDSGLDTSHVEFRERPNTVFLNPQPATAWDTPGYHGTYVSSVAAAPADGIGAVGVFPDAVLRAYAVEAVFNSPLTSDVVRGLHQAAGQGRTVINISLSGTTYSRSEYEAIISATRRGALVVAAAGNEGQRGSPLEYPASLAHVLTVGATGPTDASSAFSSASPAVDLAAPGESIPVQHPSDPNVWKLVSGTSFATPIVAAAAAAVWTARPELDAGQLADVLRQSARDLGTPGFDTRTGFGLLDMPAALALPAGPVDPQEPNDDLDQILAGRLFASARAPLASPSKRTARMRAVLDRWEDPSDVYRVVIPRGRTLTVSVASSTDLAATLWGPGTRTVLARGATAARHRLATSNRPGRAVERITYRNRTRTARTVYVDVWPGRGAARRATYTLTATIR
jgi:subtilisin family serine protease